MVLRFIPVKTDEQIAAIAHLADVIWHEYWPAIIGEAQTDYMVEHFQSPACFTRDVREGICEYWLLYAADTGRLVGYTGGHIEAETNRYFISKIYLLREERGKHFSSAVLRFYEQHGRDLGLSALYLTVNKENTLGIRAYEGNGFKIVESVVNAIGDGFVMDDYIMEKGLVGQGS